MKYCLMGLHEKENPNDEYCNACKKEHAEYIKRKNEIKESPWDRYLAMVQRESEYSKVTL